YGPPGVWFVWLAGELRGVPQVTSAIVLMISLWPRALPLALPSAAAPDEVLGVGLAVVGVGVGLADVGDGDGLGDAGDGDGDGLADWLLGDGQGVGDADTLLLGVLPGLLKVPLPWVGDDPAWPARPPWPFVLPGPPVWLESTAPRVLLPGREANVPWVCARASTTARATARVGRSQAIAGPTALRSGAPAFRRRLAEAWAPTLLRMGRKDRSPPPLAAPALALPVAASSADTSSAKLDRIALNQD